MLSSFFVLLVPEVQLYAFSKYNNNFTTYVLDAWHYVIAERCPFVIKFYNSLREIF
jgi:hypothetical protein